MNGTLKIAEFITAGKPPVEARQRAAIALRDTVGVILAGAPEAAAKIIRRTLVSESRGDCRVLGTAERAGASDAALANGVAAHAHDYDDMCFVSLAHPSCALVPAILAVGELVGASGSAVLDAYIAGFEIECRLGLVMNPRHYHERGWHCTSSIGTLGAAAAAARLLGLDAPSTVHALGIAASLACGLKENIGSMVKPLHAGMAARNGVTAARLAKAGFLASEQSIEGPQGYLVAMDSQKPPSQANVTVRLKDGRTVSERADGARGYPGRLTDDELNTKFVACAQRSLTHSAAAQVLDLLRTIEKTPNIAELTQLCAID